MASVSAKLSVPRFSLSDSRQYNVTAYYRAIPWGHCIWTFDTDSQYLCWRNHRCSGVVRVSLASCALGDFDERVSGTHQQDPVKEVPLVWRLYVSSVSLSFSSSACIGLLLR